MAKTTIVDCESTGLILSNTGLVNLGDEYEHWCLKPPLGSGYGYPAAGTIFGVQIQFGIPCTMILLQTEKKVQRLDCQRR